MLQFCPALAVSLDQESESSRITINDIFWHTNVIYLDELMEKAVASEEGAKHAELDAGLVFLAAGTLKDQ